MSKNINLPLTENEATLLYDIIRQCELFVNADISDCKQYYGHTQKVAKRMAERLRDRLYELAPIVNQ